ncbi:hypothetical protein SAMN05216317_11334 [Nitrosomonas eutropha]|uniref:Uncharacterized protein n=1 Tax=Nitrosomonas eutropha TaxID=916 RepID=A0ABX5M6I7_9PROT|nr:hypothetical protein [Nitrosomonas sp. GH22]PXV80634.1 hypothetical protein C8R14_11532 [Nitrosomonas eutropha]SCX01313.1 hypothetical protein SAMN05216379_101188 [Nitrosomonas eutropha]SDW80032.1 hypothetical protein SAMN05216317_11334 [Nitrosomonas eutropha]SEJ12419.1 hypothetical protein SAMN05216318_1262 [Nitrosomonas eutropha]
MLVFSIDILYGEPGGWFIRGNIGKVVRLERILALALCQINDTEWFRVVACKSTATQAESVAGQRGTGLPRRCFNTAPCKD